MVGRHGSSGGPFLSFLLNALLKHNLLQEAVCEETEGNGMVISRKGPESAAVAPEP